MNDAEKFSEISEAATSPEALYAPERCQTCPYKSDWEGKINRRYADLGLFATRLLDNINRPEATSATLQKYERKKAVQEYDSALERQDAIIKKHQSELAEKYNDCAGPITCRGESPLGVEAAITICGTASDLDNDIINSNTSMPADITRRLIRKKKSPEGE